jgi:two-component system, NtrC family, response regulator GlrR
MKAVIPNRALSLGFGLAPSRGSTERPERNRTPATPRARILVVDSDPALARQTVSRLRTAHYAVESVDCGRAAIEACARLRPSLVIADLHDADIGYIELLKALENRWRDVLMIVLTAHGSIQEAVRATQAGAFGYLVTPVDRGELLGQVSRAIAQVTFASAGQEWRARIAARSRLLEERIGSANRAAAGTMPILLTGENSTGKELFARAIHAVSERRTKPFVIVDCAEGAEESLERDLFGGSSVASPNKPSGEPCAYQRAEGGTLLLANVGSLPPGLQLTLSRVLRRDLPPESRFRDAAQMDVRLICTSSGHLDSARSEGAFLESLYQEIALMSIEAPPIGRRREDIPQLVTHFLDQATAPGTKRKITAEAVQLLSAAEWPGNERQLFDVVRQDLARSKGSALTREMPGSSISEAAGEIPSYDEAREQFTRAYLEENLARTAGNVSLAARIAKRTRPDFYRLLARYRLRPSDFKRTEVREAPSPDFALDER